MVLKLAIYKQALVHLEKETITSLTQNAEARYQFDNAWDFVVSEAFSEGDWNAFKKTVALSENGSATKALGYSYVFNYPADYERTIAVSNIPDFRQEFYEYVDQDGYLHANTTPVYLRYISNSKMTVVTPASDEFQWPTMFSRYVAVKLAYETCGKLTGSATLKEALEKRKDKALRQAKSVDARNEPNKRVGPGSWLRARHGGYGRSTGLGNTIVGGEIVFEEGDV